MAADQIERLLRAPAIILTPRRQTLHPIGLRQPFAGAALRLAGHRASGGIVASGVVYPRNPLLPFGQRVGGQIVLAFVHQRFGRIPVIGLDKRLHLDRQVGGGGIAANRAGASTDRRAIEPHQTPLDRQCGQAGSTACLRQSAELRGLGQIGRFGEQGEQRFQLGFRRVFSR